MLIRANYLEMQWLGITIAIACGVWLIARLWRSRYSFFQKVVLISGGSRGLGLVLARQISEQGGKVAILARDPA